MGVDIVTDPVPATNYSDPAVIDGYKAKFDQFGLPALWSKFYDLVKLGYTDPDVIMFKLADTQEYKDRFKGNAARVKAGLSELSPGSYVALENQYKSLMKTAGLPAGFYDNNDDFTSFIEHDVSPMEAQARVATAKAAVNNIDPNYRQSMLSMYGVDSGGLAAYFLNPEKATSVLEAQNNAAVVKGTATNFGVGVDKATAEQIGSNGYQLQQSQQLFGQVADQTKAAGRLGELYGDAVTSADLVKEAFGLTGGAEVTTKKSGLASQERAQFSGSSGVGQNSLGKKKSAL